MSVEQAAALFAERAAALLPMLQSCAQMPRPLDHSRTVVTGIGGSEGPARILAHALVSRGHRARFAPVSAVDAALDAEAVVVFSHALSPNAGLAIAGSAHIGTRWLVTATGELGPARAAFARSGGQILQHPPDAETGLLARVLAPTTASFVALCAFAGLRPPPEFFSALALAGTRATSDAAALGRHAFLRPWAFITHGSMHTQSHALRWKWLETLGTCDPPVYDILNFAHGPLQRWHGESVTLLGLEGTGPHWQAFASMAARCGNPRFSLHAVLPEPWSFFEYDVGVNALLTRALSLGVGHSTAWRGHGDDVALYGISGDRS